MSVLLIASDYPFGIFKLFNEWQNETEKYINIVHILLNIFDV
jgi:hypothetical protein